MNLRNFGTRLGKNYAWEVELFYTNFKGGFTPIKFEVDYESYCCDHKPSFEIELTLFSITLFHLHIYNVWHNDNPNSPFYKEWMREECKYHGEKYEE